MLLSTAYHVLPLQALSDVNGQALSVYQSTTVGDEQQQWLLTVTVLRLRRPQ